MCFCPYVYVCVFVFAYVKDLVSCLLKVYVPLQSASHLVRPINIAAALPTIIAHFQVHEE